MSNTAFMLDRPDTAPAAAPDAAALAAGGEPTPVSPIEPADLIAEAFGVTGDPLTWAFGDVFHVVISRHLVADPQGRLPQAYIQTLLTLAEQHPETEIRMEAAAVLPPEHWRTSLRVLAAAPGHRLDGYVGRMPNRSDSTYCEERADEVFDFLWALTISARKYTNDRDLSWLPTDTPTEVAQWWRDLRLRSDQILPTVRAIGYALRNAAERTSPERAARFILDHAHNPLAGSALGRLIGHLTDPAAFEVLFDIPNDVAPWHDLPLYLWRRECLRARAVPTDLANRQILESGATPLGDDFPHVPIEPLRETTSLARFAATTKADPDLVAALILADPQRWWAQLTRVDVSAAKPRGTQACLNSLAVHTELARLIHDIASQATADPALLDATHDTFSAHELAVRGTLRDRLIWLVEKASGPGFDAVVTALAKIPDVKVRRRAAKHPQIPGDTVIALTTDPDVRVRANAQHAFTRALSTL